MKIFIAIPAYDNKIMCATARSLFNEFQLSGHFGHNLKVTYLPGCSLISHARNMLTQQFLEDPALPEKMVFVDSDVGWEPGALLKLASHNKDMMAAVYRFKLEEEQYPLGYFSKEGETEIIDGLLTVASIPMGLCALSRQGLLRLKEATPERSYMFRGIKYHAFFENPFRPESDVNPSALIGEDAAFCHLWRKHGNKVWVDPDVKTIHCEGLREYAGDLGAFMRARGAVYTVPGETQSTAA